eukprot:6178615-Pleurochrysis_carterae.AAC.1
MLGQLEGRDFVKKLGEAVSHLVARADEVCLNRAVELALVKEVLPALVVLCLVLRCASVVSLFNSSRAVHEQHRGAAVEFGTYGVEEMAEKDTEKGVPLGSNTTGCSFSLAGTGGNFETARFPINKAVGKDTEKRSVGVVGLPGNVGVEVKAVVSSNALCELVVVDFLSASVLESVEVWYSNSLAAEHSKGRVLVE